MRIISISFRLSWLFDLNMKSVHAALLYRDPLSILNTTIQEIIFEETHLSLDKTLHSKVALVTTHSRSIAKKLGNQFCKNCHHISHSFANCPIIECKYCHSIGHILENCPTRPLRPKNGSFKPKNITKTRSSSLAAVTTEVSTTITISDLEALFKQALSSNFSFSSAMSVF